MCYNLIDKTYAKREITMDINEIKKILEKNKEEIESLWRSL